jgi:V/A-type H+-transporting ATPase subunit D
LANKLNLSPTKSNLIEIKDTLSVAREGYELLEQKREILVMELMKMLERAKLAEKELTEKIEDAYSSLKTLIVKEGALQVKETSVGINYDYVIKEKIDKVMGITLPSVKIEIPKKSLQYSFGNSSVLSDEVMLKFLDVLKATGKMAEIRTAVWRLSRELKKTQRRVNALDKFIIPDNEETKKYIEDTIEEKDREMLFIQKMLKKKLNKDKRI